MMLDPQNRFYGLLAGIASVSRTTLNPSMIQMYDQLLAPLGYDKVVKALEQLATERNPNDPFPSVKQIRQLALGELDPETDALEASNRIVQAVSRFGAYRVKDARTFIGSLGWLVVEREGGWANVCEALTYDNQPTLKAQWRNLAKALYMRNQAGVNEAPALPNNPNGKMASLGEVMKLAHLKVKA